MTATQLQTIRVETATPETVAPFGQHLSVHHHATKLPITFYDGKVSVYAPVSFESDDDTQLTLARVDRRAMQVLSLIHI